MNDSVLTARQAAELRSILEEIRTQATMMPNIHKDYDQTPSEKERFNYIERLARKALKNIP